MGVSDNYWADSAYLTGKTEVRSALPDAGLLSFNGDFEIPTEHPLFELAPWTYVHSDTLRMETKYYEKNSDRISGFEKDF